MLTAVQLNDKISLQTHKIGNVRANCALTPKLEAVELAALEPMPKEAFSFSGVITEVAGVVVHVRD